MRVYFFATCLGNLAYSNTCINAMRILQEAGVEIVFKKDQTCCGQPSYNSGFYQETKKLVLYNLELFSDPYPIIVPSGSCTGMMRHDYEELFRDDSRYSQVKEFCSRIYELSEFLVKELNFLPQDKGEAVSVTWHSNCHALRVAKCIPYAKKILTHLKNVRLRELEHEEECCGFGGTFSVKEPEISYAMVKEKIEDIMAQDVEYVLSGDAGCLLNISGAMSKMGIKKVQPMHFYDFLAQRMGI